MRVFRSITFEAEVGQENNKLHKKQYKFLKTLATTTLGIFWVFLLTLVNFCSSSSKYTSATFLIF